MPLSQQSSYVLPFVTTLHDNFEQLFEKKKTILTSNDHDLGSRSLKNLTGPWVMPKHTIKFHNSF